VAGPNVTEKPPFGAIRCLLHRSSFGTFYSKVVGLSGLSRLTSGSPVAHHPLFAKSLQVNKTPVTATPPEPIKQGQEDLFSWKEVVEDGLESLSHEQDGIEQASDQLEVDPAHPTTVQGSDGGRAQSEATGEGEKELAEEVATRQPCECGCGEFPKDPKSRFLPGHDLRKGI
jgi:hypothetical protein